MGPRLYTPRAFHQLWLIGSHPSRAVPDNSTDGCLPHTIPKHTCQNVLIDVRIVQTKPTRCGKRVHSRRAKSCKHVQSSLTHALYVLCHLVACTCALPYMRTRTEAAVRRVVPHSTTRQCGWVHCIVATQHVIPHAPSKLAHGALADNM